MDEMTALDHQIASDVLREAGPSEPVDGAAIFTAITATQSPKWRFQTMFSATKFVVAGVIVALFGGFLLAGVLTQQPSDDRLPAVGASASATTQAEPTDTATAEPEPTAEAEADDTSTTPDLLPGVGLVTEEVEPGVYRVLSDGAGHDLVAEPPADVTVAPDGSIWLLRILEDSRSDPYHLQVDAVYRLGQEGTHPFEPARQWGSDFAVDTDGVAWVRIGAGTGDGAVLGVFDGSTWVDPTWPDGSTDVNGIEATADGAVWVAQPVEDGPGPRVARIIDGEWTVLPALDDPALAGSYHGGSKYFAAAADGTAWLANGNFHFGKADPPPRGLLHFDGTGWQVVDLPRTPWKAGPLALGSDGTLWVYLEKGKFAKRPPQLGHLARLSAGEWSLYEHRKDGVPQLVYGQGPEAEMAADGQGRLWIAGWEDGVRSFDGKTWQHYLADLDVSDVSVMPNGNVIATVLYVRPGAYEGPSDLDWSRAGLYVITPEAVAATE